MHTFFISDYIDQLEISVEERESGRSKKSVTWIKAICPVCGGSNLKINLRTNAFACYTQECHKIRPNPIVIALAGDAFYKRTEKKYEPVRLVEYVKPLLFSVHDPTEYYTEIPYVPSWSKTFPDSKYTIYNYDDFQVVRVDPKGKKKFFYQRYKPTPDSEWVNGIPAKLKNVPLFRSDYVAASVVLSEGEKTAEYLQALGINSLAFPSFIQTSDSLPKYIRCMAHEVKNIIYLEDNDVAGSDKRDFILHNAWKAGINAVSFNVAKMVGFSHASGYDVADAIDGGIIKSRESLFNLLIKDEICRSSST